MAAPSFTRRFLWLFSGPLVWLAHFLGIYGFAGILCARPAWNMQWFGIAFLAWGVGAAAVAAIALLGAMHWKRWCRRTQDGRPDFVTRISAGLALLSATAILWESVAVFLVPMCG